MFNTQGFRDGNLHMVDVLAVPHRFKNAVGESEDQNVLNGFFSQVMIDAINLAFI